MNKRKRVVEERPNLELEMYFALKSGGASASTLIKQLVKAASSFRDKALELEEDLEILGMLYEDRMIGEEHWNRLNESSRDCELEKMCIESEANILKPGYGDTIFKDASRNSNTSVKKSKGTRDNMLHMKKREVLEAELMKKIGSKSQ